MNYAPADPHDDRLLFVRELAKIGGLNEKAIREALRSGLKHVQIGKGNRMIPKTNLRWWREYLDTIEHSSMVAHKAQEILDECNSGGKGNVSRHPFIIKNREQKMR